jgi:hypothetical protein
MAAPAITVDHNDNGDIVLTDTVASPVTTTTPATLTLPATHRWAGTREHAAVTRDMLVTAFAWLQGRHVDQSTMTSGNKAAISLPAGKHTFYSGKPNLD